MDFGFSEDQESFRQEVRSFLEEEIRRGTFLPSAAAWVLGYSQEFTKKVAEKGWIGIHWPKEYYGQGKSLTDQFILHEEMVCYGAPIALHCFSDNHAAFLLLEQGTEEQKRELLPKMLRGEICWSFASIEPDGNPLDGTIKTHAIQDGDEYVINGEKAWSTHAQYADMFMVRIKDPEHPDGKRTRDIIVDAKSPGITVRVRPFLSGHKPICQVFFDNVRVPKKNLLRAPERTGMWFAMDWCLLSRVIGFQPVWDALIQFIKETKVNGEPLCKDPLIRSKMAQIEIEREIGRLLCYRVAGTYDSGGSIMQVEAPMVKAYGAEFEQHQADIVMEILGLYGQLMSSSELSLDLGTAASIYLYSKADSIRGEPIEGLWSRIAEKGLGLPSHIQSLRPGK